MNLFVSRPLLVTLLLTLSGLCAACGSASTSAPFDGGIEDAGAPAADGGPDDAGTFVADAGALDAGAVDAGVVAVDAGIEDAGAPLDGGQVVDVTPPTVVFSEHPEAVVAVDSARFAFAASEPATFACRLDAAAASPCVSPVSLTALAEGPHVFVVVATDTAGNASRQGVVAFAVDRTPPVTVLSAHPPLASADPMARFEFTSDDPNLLGFECSLEGAPFETCFSPYELEELTHGTHTLLVRALDLAGHVEAPAVRFAWRVDFEAPIVTVLSGPTGRVTSREASLSFSTDDPDAAYGFASADSAADAGDDAESANGFLPSAPANGFGRGWPGWLGNWYDIRVSPLRVIHSPPTNPTRKRDALHR